MRNQGGKREKYKRGNKKQWCNLEGNRNCNEIFSDLKGYISRYLYTPLFLFHGFLLRYTITRIYYTVRTVRACTGDKKPVFSTIFATIKPVTSSWKRQIPTRTFTARKSIFTCSFKFFVSRRYSHRMEIYNIMRAVTWKIYMQLSFDIKIYC
jgi:hypothetical protein